MALGVQLTPVCLSVAKPVVILLQLSVFAAVGLLILHSRRGVDVEFQTEKWRPVSSLYATIWRSELERDFGIRPSMNRTELNASGPLLTETVGMLKSNGFDLVMSSVIWQDCEPADGKVKLEAMAYLAEVVCKTHGLQLSLVVDVGSAPAWLYEQYPNSQSQDASNRTYPLLSMGHKWAVERSYQFIGEVADRALLIPGCLHSIQPSWNNEYEAKYTQEYDNFQDYSDSVRDEYRQFFKGINGSLDFWNRRWLTRFPTWDTVQPRRYWQGDQKADMTCAYHDFLKFREDLGSRVTLGACQTLHTKGIDCLLHIPELYTVTDPIYQASMVWRLARSEYVKYLVMDTNFMTPWGARNTPIVAQFLVSIARSYPNKVVYFEAAFERFSDVTEAGLQHALHAGVDGLGYTNWLGRVVGELSPPGKVDGKTRATLTCRASVTTAMLLPHEMAQVIRGLNHSAVGMNKDPVQKYVLDTYAKYAGKCGEGSVHVFGDMLHFQQQADRYSKIINVQSPVLYKTTEATLAKVMFASRADVTTIPCTNFTLGASSDPKQLQHIRSLIVDDRVFSLNETLRWSYSAKSVPRGRRFGSYFS